MDQSLQTHKLSPDSKFQKSQGVATAVAKPSKCHMGCRLSRWPKSCAMPCRIAHRRPVRSHVPPSRSAKRDEPDQFVNTKLRDHIGSWFNHASIMVQSLNQHISAGISATWGCLSGVDKLQYVKALPKVQSTGQLDV